MSNEKINLVEILRGCEGMKLWSDIYGEVTLKRIHDRSDDVYHYPIVFETKDAQHTATADGRHFREFDGNCTLWPSKDCRDWSKFQKPIELRVGKTYLTRDGRVAKILFYNDKVKDGYTFLGVREEDSQWVPTWWAESGKYYVGNTIWALDLVKETDL